MCRTADPPPLARGLGDARLAALLAERGVIGPAVRITSRIAFSASTSAAVAKSPALLSMRVSRRPYMLRTTTAPAPAAGIATPVSSQLAL
ncbi:hypothetical protein RM764_43835 [Streptomyces sp. DSM 41699]|uniref:Uncharacterized protein n=1 Tax=Streptomyces gibsoniae TaxID=3075529 RepID=A0ABU2U977_9ACTN|nr:hypothetical protein [Streptomyces sp. DSM 41699]MDT0469788.1 hypothetical protein [Streptomyces sp. DSM 41699]